jgi:hypothetical protein
MRSIALLAIGSLLATSTSAQERWRQLSAGASAFHVDLHSLVLDHAILRARVQTSEPGNIIRREEVQVRCKTGQLRTVARSVYDGDTGRPLPGQAEGGGSPVWIGYPRGSEGHALLTALCQIARERNMLPARVDQYRKLPRPRGGQALASTAGMMHNRARADDPRPTSSALPQQGPS